MFLKHLKKRDSQLIRNMVRSSLVDLMARQRAVDVVFSEYENVDLSASYFENGASLTIGHVGYHTEVSV